MGSKQAKTDRMNTVRNNPPRDGSDGNGADADTTESAAPESTPATEADYLAVQLHQAREASNELRKQLMGQEKQIVDLRTQLGVANQRIVGLDMANAARENADLIKERRFELGKSIVKNNETGEFSWVTANKVPVSP